MENLDVKLAELKTALEGSLNAKQKEAMDAQVKSIEGKIAEMEAKSVKAADLTEVKNLLDEVKKALEANQPVIDALVKGEGKKVNIYKAKSMEEAFQIAYSENTDKIAEFVKQRDKGAKLSIELPGVKREEFTGEFKTVGDMTQAANITGDVVQSYNSRQGLIPADKVNFRDLVPTTYSPTGVFVTYREGAGEGSVTQQTEGSGKTQVDSDFTNVQLVNKYTAAFQRFSKQLMYNLPWLQGTLTRILMRKFYAKENLLFYAKISATTGSTGSHTTSGGNVIEKIIDLIANQRQANFTPSYCLLTYSDWAALLKTARPSTGVDYSLPAGVSWSAQSGWVIDGVQIIRAPWVTASDIQIIDSDFVERVETEAMKVEFSYDDANNFTENKVTARIECFEELNILRTDAHINYGTAS